MKKLVLSALIAVAPLSFAIAGEKADAPKADAAAAAAPAAKGGNAQTTEIPSWDTRQAGQSLDVGGDKKGAAEK
ncbi:MAG: hypothetical protein Q7T86_03800 [Hyphomicrobiaceae bacterium]|jgi:hypothetical protein|nr:hypothetical protein [Hyphomicrobiaceae bacterium]